MKELLRIALSFYGTKAITGKLNNQLIVDMFAEIGHKWVRTDDVAWCSAFINYCAKKAGLLYTGSLAARSWLKAGKAVENPEMGDLVVFWRITEDSDYGHVGIFINEDGNYVNVLGGNQAGMVRISQYEKSRVLGYRRLDSK
jgi:uncharacterized protein (TIGR02594 family)